MQRGFTLLELLVVLALVALLTGLVVPSAWRAIEGARERGVANDVQVLLEGLPVQAFGKGQALSLDASALAGRLPGLPAGWNLKVDAPLNYGPNGVAAGGAVQLVADGRVALAWRVEPVSGLVTPIATAR
jgi:prepilin-type N-terminal cleavage/methylation domain-containing protein